MGGDDVDDDDADDGMGESRLGALNSLLYFTRE